MPFEGIGGVAEKAAPLVKFPVPMQLVFRGLAGSALRLSFRQRLERRKM
jgi:hypothetical protein